MPQNPQLLVDHLQRQLLAAQRLVLLGDMSAIIAHEFNNLLTPIVARVEAALTAPSDEAYLRSVLEKTLAQAQRARAVAERLLKLARDGDCPLSACCVADVVQEALDTMPRPLSKDGVELVSAVPRELHVHACRDLFGQVLLNLLLNARRSMLDRPGRLTVSAVRADDRVRIDIRDSGAGMPREHIDNVLNPFLAADPATDPTDWQSVGLGLSACRLIARHHDARIEMLSNEGRGCTARVTWPACDAPREPAGGTC